MKGTQAAAALGCLTTHDTNMVWVFFNRLMEKLEVAINGLNAELYRKVVVTSFCARFKEWMAFEALRWKALINC